MQQVAKAMSQENNKFLVPLKVVESIQGKIISSEPLTVEYAQRGLNLLMRMQEQNIVEIRGEKSDVNIISTFVSVFAKFKCVNRLALLTENEKLAKQVMALNNNDIGGFNILVTKFDKEIGLIKWQEDEYTEENTEINSHETEELKPINNFTEMLKGWESID